LAVVFSIAQSSGDQSVGSGVLSKEFENIPSVKVQIKLSLYTVEAYKGRSATQS
jgi:hypothetical protein